VRVNKCGDSVFFLDKATLLNSRATQSSRRSADQSENGDSKRKAPFESPRNKIKDDDDCTRACTRHNRAP
jgi:hypothetical protein